MDIFMQWLVSNNILAIMVVITVSIVLISVMLIYIVAFFQGRKVSFWPPTIGEKPIVDNKTSKPSEQEKQETDLEIISYKNASSMISDFIRGIQKAKRIDDVSWMDREEDKPEDWAGQDKESLDTLREIVDNVIRKPDVVWREIRMFHGKKSFELEKRRSLDTNTSGYSLAYFATPPTIVPPRFGFAILKYENGRTEVFLSSSKVRLRVAHPIFTEFMSQYFNLSWEKSMKLKRGQVVDHSELQRLENSFIATG